MKHAAPILAAALTLLAACDSTPPAAVAEQAPPARVQRLFALGDMQPLAMESTSTGTGTGEASTGTTTGVVDAADTPDLGDGSSSSSSTTGPEPWEIKSCGFPFGHPEIGDAICGDSDCKSPDDFRADPPYVKNGEANLPVPSACPVPCDPTQWNNPECAGLLATHPTSLITCAPLAADTTQGVCMVSCETPAECPEGFECWGVWPFSVQIPSQLCFPLY